MVFMMERGVQDRAQNIESRDVLGKDLNPDEDLLIQINNLTNDLSGALKSQE